VADEDYELFWKVVRPNRRQSPPQPDPPNPCAEIPVSNRRMPRWPVDPELLTRNIELPMEHGEFVPDFEGPEGNVAPQSEFERQAVLRSQVWLGEIRRHLSRTTTAAAIWTRAGDAIRVRISEYSRTPGANLEGVDDIIRQELAPILTLIRRDGEGVLPEALNHLFSPSPVAQAIQQERNVQSLLDRVVPGSHFESSWRTPDAGPYQLRNLVTAFRNLGIPVDVYLQLGDLPASAVLTVVIDDQTIRLETTDGVTEVRIFDRL